LEADHLEAVTARKPEAARAPDVAIDEGVLELLVALVGEVAVRGDRRRERVAQAPAELEQVAHREELEDRILPPIDVRLDEVAAVLRLVVAAIEVEEEVGAPDRRLHAGADAVDVRAVGVEGEVAVEARRPGEARERAGPGKGDVLHQDVLLADLLEVAERQRATRMLPPKICSFWDRIGGPNVGSQYCGWPPKTLNWSGVPPRLKRI